MHLIRGVLIRDVGFTDMMPDVYWLTLFTIVVIAIAALRAKKNLDVLRSIKLK
jgi:ABC-2 type transport system permease protein